MNYKNKGSRYLVAHAAFWVAVLSVVALGFVLQRWTLQAADSAHDVLRSDRILTTIHAAREQLVRAESAVRGYVITREPDLLAEQRRAVAELEQATRQLAEAVSDDPSQAARAATLDGLVAAGVARMTELRARSRTRAAELRGAAAASVRANRPIYETLRAMREHETQQRTARAARYAERYEIATTIQAATLAACLLFLFAGYASFLAQVGARNRAERMLLDLTEHVPGAMFRYRQARGGASRYEYLSREVPDLFGVDRETAMAQPGTLISHVVQEDRAPLGREIRRAAKALGEFRHEFRVRLPDGVTRWIRTSASLSAGPDDTVIWNGYWNDVTAQKEAEAERDRFFTMSLDLLAVVGSDGYFKRLNPAFTQALGWSLDELMARPFIHFVHPADVEPTLQIFGRIRESREPVFDFENRYRHRDGSWRVLAWRAVATDGPFYATARDVTEQSRIGREREAAREAADAASRAKSTFLATMSHEIRTPLNGVLGMLELLALTPLDVEQRASVEVIRQSGESLNRIIDDILEFSKIEAGKLDIRPEAASIADVVAGVRNIYSGVASQKGLLLDQRVDPAIGPALLVDPLRLQQILSNFVNNALKFTATGTVTIVAERVALQHAEETVRFTVVDTGIGIPPELQRGLFQPFAQAESDTTRRFGGTGLGLAISRRLAELMGGTVAIDSAPGRGTRISVTLTMPVAHPRDLPAARSRLASGAPLLPHRVRLAPAVDAAREEGTLVLVADDHAVNRRLLVRQLNALGYAAETAEDGAAALAQWETGAYGLVLADCNMPVMDGYDLTRRIRALEAERHLPHTPIVACTANALRGEAEACLAAGMDGYLSKPVQLMALQGQMHRWLPLPDRADAATHAATPLPGPPPAEAIVLDRDVLRAVTGGEAEVERDILADFQRINDADIADLGDTVVARDEQRTASIAHRIVGASRMIGANALARAGERLELAVHAREWAEIATTATLVGREAARLRAEVAAALAGTSHADAVPKTDTLARRGGRPAR